MENETFHNVLGKRISFTKPVQPPKKTQGIRRSGRGSWRLSTVWRSTRHSLSGGISKAMHHCCHEGVFVLPWRSDSAIWDYFYSPLTRISLFRFFPPNHGNPRELFSTFWLQYRSRSPALSGWFWESNSPNFSERRTRTFLGSWTPQRGCKLQFVRRKGRLDSRYEIEDISSTFRKKKAQLVVRDFFSNLLLFDNEDSSQVCFKKTQKDWSAFATGDRWSLELEAYDSYDDKCSIVISKAHGCSIKYYQHHPNPMLSSAGWRVPQPSAKLVWVLSIGRVKLCEEFWLEEQTCGKKTYLPSRDWVEEDSQIGLVYNIY